MNKRKFLLILFSVSTVTQISAMRRGLAAGARQFGTTAAQREYAQQRAGTARMRAGAKKRAQAVAKRDQSVLAQNVARAKDWRENLIKRKAVQAMPQYGSNKGLFSLMPQRKVITAVTKPISPDEAQLAIESIEESKKAINLEERAQDILADVQEKMAAEKRQEILQAAVARENRRSPFRPPSGRMPLTLPEVRPVEELSSLAENYARDVLSAADRHASNLKAGIADAYATAASMVIRNVDKFKGSANQTIDQLENELLGFAGKIENPKVRTAYLEILDQSFSSQWAKLGAIALLFGGTLAAAVAANEERLKEEAEERFLSEDWPETMSQEQHEKQMNLLRRSQR